MTAAKKNPEVENDIDRSKCGKNCSQFKLAKWLFVSMISILVIAGVLGYFREIGSNEVDAKLMAHELDDKATEARMQEQIVSLKAADLATREQVAQNHKAVLLTQQDMAKDIQNILKGIGKLEGYLQAEGNNRHRRSRDTN